MPFNSVWNFPLVLLLHSPDKNCFGSHTLSSKLWKYEFKYYGIKSLWYVSPNDCWQGHKKEDFLVVNRNSTNWNSPVSSNHVRCIYSPCIIPSESLKGFSVGREAKSFKWNVLTKGYSLKSNFKNFFSNVTHSTLNRPKPTNWMCAPMSTLQFYLYDFHSQFFSSWFSHFC